MKKDMALYAALGRVKDDAEKQAAWHRRQLEEQPLYGWTQEKHTRYHQKHQQEAEAVANYCFIRQMQISPD